MIIKSSRAYKSKEVANLWSKCKNSIYILTQRTQNLGIGEEGITSYFSENCTQDDLDRVKEWMKLKKMDAYLCRTFKTEKNGHKTYEIILASVEKGEKEGITMPPEEYNGDTFIVTRGDFSGLLDQINKNLVEAKKYAANENQEQMIDYYIKSFAEGNLEAHKDGSRYWIKDIGPVVETNIGFIFRYRDPARVRGKLKSDEYFWFHLE